LGFDHGDIDDLVDDAIDNGLVPDTDQTSSTPVYMVVTPPTRLSYLGGAAEGSSQRNSQRAEIWRWSGYQPDPANNNTAKTGPDGAFLINIDDFSLVFSHELGEIMSDLGGGGYKVYPGDKWTGGGSGNQIGDYEGNSYTWRQSN
jgi:hypothetical protein